MIKWKNIYVIRIFVQIPVWFQTDVFYYYIRFEMDKGIFVGMILLDLQKAFDTVDHSILSLKLQALGLNELAVRWISSFLSRRHQLVDISGTFSTQGNITCGVPQGSILGPLLFLKYVNDMSAVVKNKLLLNADHSAILVSGKRKDIICPWYWKLSVNGLFAINFPSTLVKQKLSYLGPHRG